MAFIPLTEDNIDVFKLITQPKKKFSSSSSGVTGSIRVFARASTSEKEPKPLVDFSGSFKGFQANTTLDYDIQQISKIAGPNVLTKPKALEASLESYLSKVNRQPASPRKFKEVEIIRFTPGTTFTSNTLRKRVVKNVLMANNRGKFNTHHNAFTNYTCLNFFTASGIPSNSALLYKADDGGGIGGNASGVMRYVPSESFTFDFYINPKYTTDKPELDFKAGTLLHMSSCYAISLVTGTSRSSTTDLPDAFRIMLQLSHSADTVPSSVNLNVGNNDRPKPNDLIFLSSDNSLKQNHWHHVSIRWGGSEVQDHTGSFVIDGIEDSSFIIASDSVMNIDWPDTVQKPNALFVGNYYTGQNQAGDGSIAKFFNSDIAKKEGVPAFDATGSDNGGKYLDDSERLEHPLNAEVHDLKIFNSYQTDDKIQESISGSKTPGGFWTSLPEDLIFYVPPFFVSESRTRQMPLTPFQFEMTSSDTPFTSRYSFGVGGFYLNLENYTREFVTGQYPRILHLTASEIEFTTDAVSPNDIFYNTNGGSEAPTAEELLDGITKEVTFGTRKRNLTVLPCDNGKFFPRFALLFTGSANSSERRLFVDDLGNLRLDLVSLSDLVTDLPWSEQSVDFILDDGATTTTMTQVLDPLPPDVHKMSPTEYTASLNEGAFDQAVLSVLRRTKDPDSNEVVYFDISNLFYGERLKERHFKVQDTNMTGSGGKVNICLKDNGLGNIYRADALTPHASWASVGNIFYDEGIVYIKSPNLAFFGKDQFDVEMTGQHSVHVMEVSVPCPKGMVNSSSNPSWKRLKPSDYISDIEDQFVYITSVNLHDENFNVVARANLSNPVVKTNSDSYLFRFKVDF